jgi:hypothetical protein
MPPRTASTKNLRRAKKSLYGLRWLHDGAENHKTYAKGEFVRRPSDALYNRADALVAALGALPYVAQGFREVPIWAVRGSRWNGVPGDEQLEGLFMCVE